MGGFGPTPASGKNQDEPPTVDEGHVSLQSKYYGRMKRSKSTERGMTRYETRPKVSKVFFFLCENEVGFGVKLRFRM